MRIDPERGLWVRAPTPLGDFLAAEPALRALAHAFKERGLPGALSITAPARMASLVESHLCGARILPSELEGRELVARLHGTGAALLFAGSFRSAWTAMRARIPVRVGLSRDGRGLLLTDPIRPALERGRTPLELGVRGRSPRILPRPGAATYAELLGAIGVPLRDRRPRLAASPEVIGAVGERLVACGLDPGLPFLCASIGGATGAVAKSPPIATWVALLERIWGELGWPILLVPGPGDEGVARAIGDRLGPGIAKRMGDRAPDLEQLAAILARSAAVLTGDTGPRHVARAVGTPAVVLIGSTDPRHTALGLGRERVLGTQLACAPCHRSVCPRATAPGTGAGSDGADRECLTSLEPERALGALAQLL